ncbi:ArsR/SmtB family transcription factor [Paenibacillus sp. FSL R7-0331]|uniref:ArsR/SmtB family transcription factor n=1 Tax=Paenibacillus sp. FSL R7-0331 TaxID=1536773 RepID=UPI0004F84645|nr:ArsR family transcriptional regulator [Paenibacillus sp. FSL R7-0331]AIQ51683.1 ArsR family transcriptional regulator [Paenibacillus sp. FSL R7-0331]
MKLDLTEESLPVYEALSSSVRLHMLRLLAVQPMNVKELAGAVKLSSAIMTMHVRKLEAAGLISTHMAPGKSGLQKICSLAAERAEITFPAPDKAERKAHRKEIPVGHYSDFQIEPTCGLATTAQVIGSFDDPRYFWDMERMNAGILWFGKGFVEYKIPNFLLSSQQPDELIITMEIASEAPSINNNWPSDITFTLNGKVLGFWTSPGDYGDSRGKYTPAWWPALTNQYGLLKQLRITPKGTFMDGLKLSDVTLDQVGIRDKQWTFRLSVEENAEHIGGLTLFGKGFGNYNDDLVVELFYTDGTAPAEQAE